jgi:LEA14-like dessication related protein
MPFGFPLEMTQAGQDITAYESGVAMATMKVPMSTASGTSASGRLSTSISDVPMQVLSNQHAHFNQFTRDVIMTSGKSMTMRGTVSAVAKTAIGDVLIEGIKLDQRISIQGLQGLNTAPVVISNVRLVGGTPEALEIRMDSSIINPSDLSMSTGDLTVEIYSSGEKLGTAVIRDLHLKPGINTVDTTFYFAPETAAARQVGKQALESFTSGTDFDINIAGFSGSTSVTSLSQGFSELRFTAGIPAIHDKLVRDGKYTLNLLSVALSQSTQARVNLYNPFDTALVITSMKASVVTNGVTLGTVETNFNGKGVTLPPKSTTLSPILELSIKIGLQTLTTVLSAPDGLLIASIDGVISIDIGGYTFELHYKQDNIRMERVGSL